MHRSGTSAFTRVLSLAGADLPRNLLAVRPDNERGYWESTDLLAIHDRLLAALGRSWDDVRPLPPGWLDTEAARRGRGEILEVLRRDFGDSSLFVLKDPRLCLLLPLWADILGEFGAEPAFVFAFRNPLEVAASLRVRNDFDPHRGLLLWVRHVVASERSSRRAARSIVSYESLLADWRGTLRRIARDIGLRWPALSPESAAEVEAFLDSRLRHSAFSLRDLTRSAQLVSWVSDLYQALRAAEKAARWQSLAATVDRVAAALEDADLAFGPVLDEAAARYRESEELRAEIGGARAARTERDEELRVLLGALSDAQRDLGERRARADALAAEITAAREATVRSTAEVDRLAGELARVQIEAETRSRSIRELEEALANVRREADQHVAELRAAVDELGGRARDVDAVAQALSDARRENEARAAALGSLRDQLSEALAEGEALAADLARSRAEAETRFEAQGKEIEDLRERLAESQGGHATKDSRLGHLEGRLATTMRELGERETALARQAATTEELQREVVRLSSRDPWVEIRRRLVSRFPSLRPASRLARLGWWTVTLQLPARLAGVRRRRSELERLSSSPLFDADWYLRRYPDAANAIGGPLAHYVRFGAAEGRLPGPLFDAAWYLDRNPDVKAAGVNPLAHYLGRGAAEARDPNPLFDTSWYLERNPDVAASGHNPLEHYLRHGAAEGRDPGPAFSSSWYLLQNPDVRAIGLNPLAHYLQHGQAEGRAPTPPPGETARVAPAVSPPTPPRAGRVLLFIGHDASRTGAPLILLNLVRQAARYGQIRCLVILDQAGPLLPDYEAVAEVHVMKLDRHHRGGAQLETELTQVLASLDGQPVAAICNTAETAAFLPSLRQRGIPCLSLVHEMLSFYSPVYLRNEPPPPLIRQLAAADALVFPSRAVAAANRPVIEALGTEAHVLSQGLLDPSFGQSGRRQASEVFASFGVNDETLVVLGCGNADWRKGFDLFCLVALKTLALLNGRIQVRFAWVGGCVENFQSAGFWGKWELRKLGLEEALIQVREVADPEPYYQSSDVFLLPSRGDPFPCVVHEAMACGLPVVAFEGSGGAAEAVGGTGILVPYLDTDAMARGVVELLEDAERRHSLGEAARKRVREEFVFDDYARDVLALARTKAHLPEWGFGLAPRPDRSRGRIVFSSPDWSISGVNTFTRELVTYLLDAGYDAEILFTQDWALRHERDFLPDVPHRFLRPRSQSIPDRWNAFEEYLKGEAPCVLVPNYDYGMSSICPRLPSSVGILGIVHSDDVEHYEHVYRLGRYWNRIVAVSHAIRDEVVRLNPAFAPLCSVIPYGLDLPAAPPRARRDEGAPLELVYSGRLVQFQKRVLDYPKLVNLLEERGIGFRLTMVGDGELFEGLQQAMADSIREGRVVLTGRLSPEAAAEVYRRSDVYLLLSEFEGLPLSVIEALHFGCIPVVRRVRSGVEDLVVDGVNGYVVEPDDWGSFADRLCALQTSGELRERLSAEAQATIGRCGLDRVTMGRRYGALFDEVLGEVREGGYVRPPPLSPERLRGTLPSPYLYLWHGGLDG